LCALLSGGQEICEVAILTDGNDMAWEAARALYQAQTGFLYIDGAALAEAAVYGDRLVSGPHAFRAVVCDPALPEGAPLPPRLEEFARAGGAVFRSGTREDLAEALAQRIGRDAYWPGAPDVRCLHYRRGALECYFLVNEGEKAVRGTLSLGTVGALEVWDPLTGSTRPHPARAQGDSLVTWLALERRQGLVLAVDPARPPNPQAPLPPEPGEVLLCLDGPWEVTDTRGQAVDAPALADWARRRGWETFSGTLRFATRFTAVPEALTGPVWLDLGAVGDIARVRLNGQDCGQRCWSPYTLRVDGALRPGPNRLEVEVTNSMANAYDGSQLPSGLLGQVVLRGADGSAARPYPTGGAT